MVHDRVRNPPPFKGLGELALLLAIALAPACKGDDAASGTATTGPTTSGTSAGTTDATTTAGSGESSSSTSASTAASTSTTAATTDTSTSGAECVNAALGASCVDAMCDCASDACYVVGPLGGVCSECDEDADCAATTGFGCNFGNPLTGTPAVCSKTGAVGQGCESADACADGLSCPTVIDVPGIFSVSTCSECESDSDCTAQECTPTYDLANFGGYYHCVDIGSVADNEGCDLTGDGAECISGNCAPAALMGIPVIAVCSPCNEDADCMPGMTCQLPEVVLEGDAPALVPGGCV